MNTPISSAGSQDYVQISSDIAAHLQTLTPSSNNSEDVHICGRCKHNFSDINLFVEHKRSGCTSSSPKSTNMAPSLAYVATTASGSEDEMTCAGPSFLRVILEGGDRQILRSRLLGQTEPQGEQPAFHNSSSDVQELVMQQHSKREFHIDEEDVATLLANQLANEVVNSVHGASISSTRSELLSLENEIIIPEPRDTLDLGAIALTERNARTLEIESEQSSLQCIKSRKRTSPRSPTRSSSPVSGRVIAEDKLWGQSQPQEGKANGNPVRGKKRHQCLVNGCVFTTCYLKDLVRHVRKHTGERPFQCEACQRTFSRGDKLQMHLRIHSGEKPHRCQQCDYATIDSGSLRKHMRIHNDERPYKCQICPYRSRDSSQLTVHLRTHTGDNPFVCPYESCPSAFKTSSDLKRHARMHTGEKPFSCDLCDYKCAIKSNLRVHVRLNHTEVRAFSCHTCSHVATSKRAAREHEKVHAEEVLKCGVCAYSCISPAGMRSHIKVHKEDKPFACKQCPYTCRQQGNLKSHMKKKHPDCRVPKKGKSVSKDPASTAKGSTSRISSSKTYVHSKPFCIKSHHCTFCDAAFVREDSWRSHMRQHQHQTREASIRDENGTTQVLRQDHSGSNQHTQEDMLSPETFMIIDNNSSVLTNDSKFGVETNRNNNVLQLVSEDKDTNSNSFLASPIRDKADKEHQLVQHITQQEIIDSSNLQTQPVFLYVQNAPVTDGSLDDSLRNAEILASLNQATPLMMTGRCGQYLSLSTDQTSLMEQLAASLQPGMQYVLSGPLEGVVGNDTTYVQATGDAGTNTGSDTAIPIQSIISVHMEKATAVEEKH